MHTQYRYDEPVRKIPVGDRLELHLRRRNDGAFDLRLFRCSPLADPTTPGNYQATLAGFRVAPEVIPELRAALRELVEGDR